MIASFFDFLRSACQPKCRHAYRQVLTLTTGLSGDMRAFLIEKASPSISYSKFCSHAYLIGTILVLLFFSSCSSSKYLAGDEYLLRGNTIKLHADDKLDRKRTMKYELSTLYKQTENNRFFFMPREWFYFVTDDPEDTTKFDRLLRRVIAEPPAIYD
ncbi:MAG: hypothetical protein KI786_19545, partial [Mameliella sp.]|nr:hypothetical protein [Phaeodactylibacter sp.]